MVEQEKKQKQSHSRQDESKMVRSHQADKIKATSTTQNLD